MAVGKAAATRRAELCSDALGGELIELAYTFIPGRPLGKDRPRFGQGRVFSSKETLAYERLIRDHMRPLIAEPSADPIKLQLRMIVEPPENPNAMHVKRPHRRKPDVDNFVKIIMDSLNPYTDNKHADRSFVGAYVDDVQVVDLSVRKDWSLDGEGVFIRIWRIV